MIKGLFHSTLESYFLEMVLFLDHGEGHDLSSLSKIKSYYYNIVLFLDVGEGQDHDALVFGTFGSCRGCRVEIVQGTTTTEGRGGGGVNRRHAQRWNQTLEEHEKIPNAFSRMDSGGLGRFRNLFFFQIFKIWCCFFHFIVFTFFHFLIFLIFVFLCVFSIFFIFSRRESGELGATIF